MKAIRRAEVTWEGNLIKGNGAVDAASSEAFTGLPVTWASRTENPTAAPAPRSLLPPPMPAATPWPSPTG